MWFSGPCLSQLCDVFQPSRGPAEQIPSLLVQLRLSLLDASSSQLLSKLPAATLLADLFQLEWRTELVLQMPRKRAQCHLLGDDVVYGFVLPWSHVHLGGNEWVTGPSPPWLDVTIFDIMILVRDLANGQSSCVGS